MDHALAVFDAAWALDQSRHATLERLITLRRATRQHNRKDDLLANHTRLVPDRTGFRDKIA